MKVRFPWILSLVVIAILSCGKKDEVGKSDADDPVVATLTIGEQKAAFKSSESVRCNVATNGTTTNGRGKADSASFEFRNSSGSFTVNLGSYEYGESYRSNQFITHGETANVVSFSLASKSYSSSLVVPEAEKAGSGCSVVVQYSSSGRHTLDVSCTSIKGTAGDKSSMVLSLKCPGTR